MDRSMNERADMLFLGQKDELYSSLDCLEKIVYNLAGIQQKIPCDAFLKTIYPVIRVNEESKQWNLSISDRQMGYEGIDFYELKQISTSKTDWYEVMKKLLSDGEFPVITGDYRKLEYFTGNSLGMWGTNHYAIAVGYDDAYIYFADNLNEVVSAAKVYPYSRIKKERMFQESDPGFCVFTAEIYYDRIRQINVAEELIIYRNALYKEWNTEQKLSTESGMYYAGKSALKILMEKLDQGDYESDSNRFLIDHHIAGMLASRRRIFLACLAQSENTYDARLEKLLKDSILCWDMIKMFVMRNSIHKFEDFPNKIKAAIKRICELEDALSEEL